jgi:hypothetical protein
MLRVVSSVLLVVLTSAPVAAAELPEELFGMLGDWVIEQEDPTLPTCTLNLLEDEAIGGYAVTVPAPCTAPPFPAADAIVAWNIDDTDGSLILLDALRHVTLRFFEEEDGLFATDPAVEPHLYLLPPMTEEVDAVE